MMQADPPSFTSKDEKAPPVPRRFGGVLIVVAIGLILSFLQGLGNLGTWLRPFREPVWERLTVPGSSSYHPYWKPDLIFGLSSTSLLLLLCIIALVLFFRKHRFFPTFMIVVIPLMFVLMLVGYFLDSLVPAIVASPQYATEAEHLVIKFIALHVWIPYFIVSDRVKRTFVR